MPQVVIAIAEYKMARADPRFPVGRTRLETVGAHVAAVCCMRCCLPVKRGSLQDVRHDHHVFQLSLGHKCGSGTPLVTHGEEPAAGVVACAVIMTIATLAVIESASNDLVAGIMHGAGPDLSWRHGML